MFYHCLNGSNTFQKRENSPDEKVPYYSRKPIESGHPPQCLASGPITLEETEVGRAPLPRVLRPMGDKSSSHHTDYTQARKFHGSSSPYSTLNFELVKEGVRERNKTV